GVGLAELLNRRHALLGGQARPLAVVEGVARDGDRVVDVGRSALGDAPDEFLRVRGDHVDGARPGGVDPLAADEQLPVLAHVLSPRSPVTARLEPVLSLRPARTALYFSTPSPRCGAGAGRPTRAPRPPPRRSSTRSPSPAARRTTRATGRGRCPAAASGRRR